MQFLLIVLLFCFFIFLFCLHAISKEDYVFIRKNITLEHLFSFAFLVFFFGLFISRVFYIIFNPDPIYFNPLVFLLLPYYPGLSLIGGVIGGGLFLLYYARLKKLPLGRIADFFSIALLLSLPFGYIGVFMLNSQEEILQYVIPAAFFLLFFVISLRVFFPRIIRNNIKEGMMALLFFISFTFILMLQRGIQLYNEHAFVLKPEDHLLILTGIITILLYARIKIGKSLRKP